MATPLDGELDQIRSTFPQWAMFRSDGGAFYATRRGVTLTYKQFDAGLEQTIYADDLPAFVNLLQNQERMT